MMDMGRERTRETDILLERASPPREKRYIYSGEAAGSHPGYALAPNKRSPRRRVSTFNIILTLFAAGIAIVLYVNNFLTVNHLAAEVDQLQGRYDALANTNATLRAEVSRKSSWERIGDLATKQLGLMYPKEQPTMMEVDEGEFGKPPDGGAR